MLLSQKKAAEGPLPIFDGVKTWKRRPADAPVSSQTKWNNANREKLHAHAAVRAALRAGTLVRGRCEDCGSFRTEAHHEDYSKPLSVIWLCRRDHRRRHAAERECRRGLVDGEPGSAQESGARE
jgi:hypothetical protein